MKYVYTPGKKDPHGFGETYICNHPVYSRCTLFEIGNKGFAVIQQRYDPKTKATFWTEIDKDLTNDLYLNENFKGYFTKTAETPKNGLYPTVTIRQIMWSLRMKPLKREAWETYFCKKTI